MMIIYMLHWSWDTMYTKTYDHMMYSSWDVVCDRQTGRWTDQKSDTVVGTPPNTKLAKI